MRRRIGKQGVAAHDRMSAGCADVHQVDCAQIEALERQADEVVLLESRAELAESERDTLLEARTLT